MDLFCGKLARANPFVQLIHPDQYWFKAKQLGMSASIHEHITTAYLLLCHVLMLSMTIHDTNPR